MLSLNSIPLPHFHLPVLTPEQKGEEETDIGDVVAVVAAHQLDGGNWQVANKIAEAHGADHLGHAQVPRRQLRTTGDVFTIKMVLTVGFIGEF